MTKLSMGLMLFIPLFSASALADNAGSVQNTPAAGAKVHDGSVATSSYRNRLAWGTGVASFMTWLSNVGIDHVASTEMARLEPRIQTLLAETGLPGALVLFDIQTSRGDTNVNNFIGGKPQFIGAGLKPLETYQAFTLGDQMTFYPKPSDGYVRNDAASKFLWITRDQNGLKYATVDAQMLKSEVRRLRNDGRLQASLARTYEAELIGSLARHLEQNAQSEPMRAAARALISSAQEAAEAKKKLDADLDWQLKKIERINRLMNQLETGVAVAQVIDAARTEFKDRGALFDKITDQAALKSFLEGESAAAQQRQGELRGTYRQYDDRSTGRSFQMLDLIRDSKINPADVPGIKANVESTQ